MKSENQLSMRRVRDLLHEVIGKHEHSDHGGNCCWGNRAGAIAYLAHTLGFHPDQLATEVYPLLQQYERDCPDCEDLQQARKADLIRQRRDRNTLESN